MSHPNWELELEFKYQQRTRVWGFRVVVASLGRVTKKSMVNKNHLVRFVVQI